MKRFVAYIAFPVIAVLSISLSPLRGFSQNRFFDFFNKQFSFAADSSILVPFEDALSTASIRKFYATMDNGSFHPIIQSLLKHKENNNMNDWLYYQLVRKVAQTLSPKEDNYARYTLYKWFFMLKSGFDARLAYRNEQIIFYIRSEEDISDLPYLQLEKGTYICLNYHDYGALFNNKEPYTLADLVDLLNPQARGFSYKVTRLPEFKPENYVEKELAFKYQGKAYHFKIKINDEVTDIFKNYPIVDFETYFNIPMSAHTYESLIPVLRTHLNKLPVAKGVDYLMRFTRYAFLYEDDRMIFGKEKRMSPEETLSSNASDCDDRAALFFYLVKEIYNLPMLAIRYPTHVTVAVQFRTPVGKSIFYEGNYYTICEPTPQDADLSVGEVSSKNERESYEIVYHYAPQ
ncbi:hypothetical protein [Sphingobacterium suaedae]|uniref:Transglutaminase domain-containing protein n=1 Tax=Sphingobacterium suaedae TaxID=1686402 RepID=A0ABW5KJI2_9SPHI